MPRRLRRLVSAVRALGRRRRMEGDLDEELRFHLDQLEQENLRRGMRPEDARHAALRAFGGVEQVREECRDAWGVRFLETLGQDVRYGWRRLLREPGFALTVVLTLALGIGANSAIFSVVNGVLLRPLPYGEGERLLRVRLAAPRIGLESLGLSPLEVRDLGEQARSLSGVAEYHNMTFTLLGRAEPERVETGVVSANFFDVLGVKPLLGRTFRPGDDAPGAEPVLVLAHEYWKRSHGGDPAIVGRTFEMNDRMHTVVGVLPPLPSYPDPNQVFMPTSACPFRSRTAVAENRQGRMLAAFARLAPGVTEAAARADLAAVAGRMAEQYPEAYPPDSGVTATLAPLRDELTRRARPTFLILLGTVALVLLIACANVANLSLARILSRERELAVRTALGAGRVRIVRQLLTESLLLAGAGGVVGLLLALGGLDLLKGFAERFTPRAGEIQIDAAVLAFTAAVSVLTGLAFGTLPAFAAPNLLAALKDGGDRTTGGGRHRLRMALVMSQLALSFVLLIGAALMIRSLGRLQAVDPGFESENVLALTLDLNWSRYLGPDRRTDPDRIVGFYDRLLERVAALPGARMVAAGTSHPLGQYGHGDSEYEIEGRPVESGQAPPRATLYGATPDYFAVLGVPLLRGRSFEEGDRRGAPSVVLVNQTLARRRFGASDPVGQRLSFDGHAAGPAQRNRVTVVGVVADVRQHSLDREPVEELYFPLAQFPPLSASVLIRTAGDPMALARDVRAAVYALDPEQAVTQVRTLEQVRTEALASPRLTTTLLGVFAALALGITAAGIAGVMAFAVTQRTREIGIRMALGARPGTVLGLVLRQGLGPVAAGLALGVAAALALGRLISGLLYGVEPTDVWCFAGSAVVLVAVASLACALPARKATAVDPMLVLRES